MNELDKEKLREEGYTEAGIAAIQQGWVPPPLPSLEERLAQAVIVPEPWTSEYVAYVDSLKEQMRIKLQAVLGVVR